MDTTTLPPSRFSEDHLQPDTVIMLRAVARQFPQLTDVGGWRASDPYPDHPEGRALDFMVGETGVALGQAIHDFLWANADAFGLQYTIWRQTYQDRNGSNLMEDRGSPTQNHMDHVHATTVGNSSTGGGIVGGTAIPASLNATDASAREQISAIGDALKSVSKFLDMIRTGEGWSRYLKVIAGSFLILAGAWFFMQHILWPNESPIKTVKDFATGGMWEQASEVGTGDDGIGEAVNNVVGHVQAETDTAGRATGKYIPAKD